MNKRLLLIFLLCLIVGLLNAQTNFKPGYIIKVSGDTTFGEIDSRGGVIMSRLCKFKLNKVITNYSPSDIIEYRFTNGQYFVSKEYMGKKIFFEFLLQGKINLYYLNDKKGDRYFIEKEGYKLSELTYEKGIKYVDDIPYEYTTDDHIKLLSQYMQDAPALQSTITNFGPPEYRDLILLAKKYQNMVCNADNCIIYTKSTPAVKMYLEVLGGITFNNSSNFISKITPSGGVITSLRVPHANEKIFLRTGLMYYDIELNDKSYSSFIKIPIQVEYIYPKSMFRPKFSYGYNVLFPLQNTIGMMAGFNLILKHNIFLSFNYDFDFYPRNLPLVPGPLISSSLTTGISISM